MTSTDILTGYFVLGLDTDPKALEPALQEISDRGDLHAFGRACFMAMCKRRVAELHARKASLVACQTPPPGPQH